MPVTTPAISELTVDSNRILEGLGTAVVVIDAAATLVTMNPAAEQLLGHGPRHPKGTTVAKLFDRCPALAELASRVIEAKRPHALSGITIEAQPGRGGETLVDCNAMPIDLDDGTGVLIELVDITRREKILRETALLDQHGVSRTMVRQLAHEIKNPLGGLRGAAQLLEKRLPDAALREYTGIIISEADRLAALADTLLGPTRPAEKTELSIHELLEHLLRLLQADAPPGVVIERDYDPSLPTMQIDRGQIVQAMLNLGRNALQAVGETGHIVLRTRALARFTIGSTTHRLVACIEVEDDGPGVPGAIRDQIFFPLVSGGAGSGLGLSLAQDLVQRHDGLIEFSSTPGHTVFQMLLPIYNSGMPASNRGRTEVSGKKGRGNRGRTEVSGKKGRGNRGRTEVSGKKGRGNRGRTEVSGKKGRTDN